MPLNIHRYNVIPTIGSALVALPLADAQDLTIAKYAPAATIVDSAGNVTGQLDPGSILYALQENLVDQFTPPVTPVGLTDQELSDWIAMLEVAGASWRINVANIITGFILLFRGYGMGIFPASVANPDTPQCFIRTNAYTGWGSDFENYWRLTSVPYWNGQTVSGGYYKPGWAKPRIRVMASWTNSALPAFIAFLSGFPTMSQCRAYLLNETLPGYTGNVRLMNDLVGGIPPTAVTGNWINGGDDSEELLADQPAFSGMPSYKTCLSILQYCAGTGEYAAADALAALSTYSSNQKTMLAYQNAFAGQAPISAYLNARDQLDELILKGQQAAAAQAAQAAAAKAAQAAAAQAAQAAAAKAAQAAAAQAAQAAAAQAAQAAAARAAQAAAAKAALAAAAQAAKPAAAKAAMGATANRAIFGATPSTPAISKMSIAGIIAAAIGILLLL